MKMVRFTRPVLPHRVGEQKAVPDHLAMVLAMNGDAEIVPSVFDAPGAAVAGDPRDGRRPTLHLKTYRTRGQG